MRRTFPAGIATACPSRCRSRRPTAAWGRRSTPRRSAPPAASMRYKQIDSQRKDFKRLGVLGDWDHPVPHHGSALRGGAAARLLRHHQERPRLQGLQAGALVLELPLGAGRGGGRVRGHHLAEHLRALRGHRPARISRAVSAWSRKAARSTKACPPRSPSGPPRPWTLPANQAVAVHPQFDYALVEFDLGDGRERLIARDRAHQALDADARHRGAGPCSPRPRARCSRSSSCSIPSMSAAVPVILGDHVTLDAGTGAVHTAPGHGLDDYIVGRRYGLEVENPVGGDGRFLPSTPMFAGEGVFDANAHVIEVLGRARPSAQGRAVPSRLSALLAPQDAGDFSCDAAVVHQHGSGGAAQGARSRPSRTSTGCPPGASSASAA